VHAVYARTCASASKDLLEFIFLSAYLRIASAFAPLHGKAASSAVTLAADLPPRLSTSARAKRGRLRIWAAPPRHHFVALIEAGQTRGAEPQLS
jgi:hypothetical protein